MLKFITITISLFCLNTSFVQAEEVMNEGAHVHYENGVVYCDVESFDHEAYALRILGAGSPLTATWSFKVSRYRDYWLDKDIAEVSLGRQVIPDLVTKRWLMRDLSGGVLKYTSDVDVAMRFLTSMNHVAVMDISLLEADAEYGLGVMLLMHEGELKEAGWWTSLTNWGEDMGSVDLRLPKESDGK